MTPEVWESRHLDQVLDGVWRLLERGCAMANDPCHTPVLATRSSHAEVSLRTVVLRGVDRIARTLTFHTHVASDKVPELREKAVCGWHFYAPEEKVQVRVRARASLHHQDELARGEWDGTGLSSRRCYCTIARPGQVLPAEAGPISGLPPELEDRQPTEEESERLGWPNFVAVKTRIERFEYLYLRAQGHRRAAFTWPAGSGEPEMVWLVP